VTGVDSNDLVLGMYTSTCISTAVFLALKNVPRFYKVSQI